MKKIKFLTIMMVIGAFTFSSLSFMGCNKKSSDGNNVIEADSEWFDVETNELQIPSEISETENTMPIIQDKIITNDDQFLSILAVENTLSNEITYYLLLNHLDGELKNYTKISEPISLTSNTNYTSYRLQRNKDSYVLSTTENNSDSTTNKIQEIDLDNFKIIEEPVDVNDAYLYGCALGKENQEQGYVAFDSLYVGDKLISVLNKNMPQEQLIAITDKSNNIQNINIKDTFKLKDDNCYFYKMMPMSSTEVLFEFTNNENFIYYTFNLENNEATEFTANDEFCDTLLNAMWSYTVDSDENIIVNSNGELSKLNFKEQKTEEIFNFGNAYINPALMNNASIVSTTNDKYIFFSENMVTNQLTNKLEFTRELLVFSKAKENPNKGKDVITLASMNPTGLTPEVGDIIYDFNKENDKFFVKYAPEYEIKNTSFGSKDKQQNSTTKTTTDLVNKLSDNIIDGVAPDIILDAFDNDSLNNDRYFEDLSSHEFDSDDYYTNIIEAAKTSNKLYQLPLSFTLDAISTSAENVEASAIGFDFDSYKTFVEQKCNGNDPIIDSVAFSHSNNETSDFRSKLLKEMLKAMAEPVIKNNKININNDDFKAVVDYVKITNQAPESSNNFLGMQEINTTRSNSFSISNYMDYLYISQTSGSNKAVKLLGLPSTKAHTPAAVIKNSAAITVTSKHKDAAWEFIESVLNKTHDKNDLFSSASKFNINKKTQDNTLEALVNVLNNQLQMSCSKEDFAVLNDAVENVEFIEKIDASLFNIISEELDPYFNDQKSYDDVLKIITDRCSKFLDENK